MITMARAAQTRTSPPESPGGDVVESNKRCGERRPSLLADRFAPAGGSGLLPLRQAVGDGLHRAQRRLRRARIAGQFALDAIAFALERLTHALQFDNRAIDFLNRGARNPLDQRIGSIRAGLVGLGGGTRTTPETGIAAYEFPDLAFDFSPNPVGGCSRLINITKPFRYDHRHSLHSPRL